MSLFPLWFCGHLFITRPAPGGSSIGGSALLEIYWSVCRLVSRFFFCSENFQKKNRRRSDIMNNMENKQFFLNLIPPRPTFFMDITEDERNIMNEHGKYWQKLMAQGIAFVFGPVMDPKGVWGLGIVEAINEDDVRSITADDPAIKSGLTTLEIYPI